jgi:TM2 domain-containing membrane protein YozV
MSGRANGSGACGNVICALASFFIPGLGQLLQGRWVLAAVMFVLTALLWLILLGWIIHLWSIVDAAVYKPGKNDSDAYDRYNEYRNYRRHRNHDRYYRA